MSVPNHFATFWPPSGLLLAALLLRDVRWWPLGILAVLPANLAFDLLHGRSLAVSFGFWSGNVLEAAVGAYVLRQVVGVPVTLARLKEVVVLTTLSALGATTLSATVGAAVAGFAYGHGQYWSAWQVWWIGDAVGVMLVAPFVLTWFAPRRATSGGPGLVEWACFLAASLVVVVVLVGRALVAPRLALPLPLVIFPLLGWAAWRFGPRGTATAMLLIGLVTIWNHLHGSGFFSPAGPLSTHSVVVMQAFLLVASMTFLGIAASIAEARRANEEVYEIERRFQTMADSAPVLLWMANEDGECVFTNQTWVDVTGRPVVEAQGMGWLVLLHPDDVASTLAVYRTATREQAPMQVEFRLRHADGTYRWMLSAGRPRFDRAGTCLGYIGCATDITDRKEIEAERQRRLFEEVSARERAQREADELALLNVELAAAREAAQDASRLKSEFLANVSHEIRTPMTVILGYADMLADRHTTEPDRARCVDKIRRNGEHLITVLNDILDISKIEAGRLMVERVPCSAVAIVAQVASLLRVQALEKGLELAVEYRGLIPETILSDPTRLRQILLNLVGNAVKFTQSGGVRVVVTLADGPAAGERSVRVDVVDTGIGIRPEVCAMLFQPFVQGDPSMTRQFGGTGLGLTIAKRLATMLGGDLVVASMPGEGSTFTLTVACGPLEAVSVCRDPGEAVIPAPPSAPGSVHRLRGRILLAEDSADSRRLIGFYLERAGAEVHFAHHGAEASDLALAAERAGSPFDVVLMDMQMPVLDGYRAIMALRSAGYPRPIVGLTAHAMAGDRDKCLAAGCDDYATKPIDEDVLIATVEQYMPPVGRPAARGVRSPARRAGADLAALTRAFVAELPERAAALERHLVAGDLARLGVLAHQLKGTAAGYGLPEEMLLFVELGRSLAPGPWRSPRPQPRWSRV